MGIAVFYNPAMAIERELESPSPRKPAEVVAQWAERYAVDLMDFAPLPIEDFHLAHAKPHVDGVMDLSIANGMDTKDRDVADSLPWTSGSLHAAALHALRHGAAASPTSGFHHAGHDYSWGFCTFNGLMVCAIKLLNSKLAAKVGILDFDQHEGDGTQHIIETLGLASEVIHRTGKSHYPRERGAFFEALPSLFESMGEAGIILYQAGADQHVDDPLGGFLDGADLRRRDRAVFEFAKARSIPIAWNLAGGYQESVDEHGRRSIQKVLDIHNATMEECLRIFGG